MPKVRDPMNGPVLLEGNHGPSTAAVRGRPGTAALKSSHKSMQENKEQLAKLRERRKRTCRIMPRARRFEENGSLNIFNFNDGESITKTDRVRDIVVNTESNDRSKGCPNDAKMCKRTVVPRHPYNKKHFGTNQSNGPKKSGVPKIKLSPHSHSSLTLSNKDCTGTAASSLKDERSPIDQTRVDNDLKYNSSSDGESEKVGGTRESEAPKSSGQKLGGRKWNRPFVRKIDIKMEQDDKKEPSNQSRGNNDNNTRQTSKHDQTHRSASQNIADMENDNSPELLNPASAAKKRNRRHRRKPNVRTGSESSSAIRICGSRIGTIKPTTHSKSPNTTTDKIAVNSSATSISKQSQEPNAFVPNQGCNDNDATERRTMISSMKESLTAQEEQIQPNQEGASADQDQSKLSTIKSYVLVMEKKADSSARDEVVMFRTVTVPIAPIKKYVSVLEKKRDVIDMVEICKRPKLKEQQSTSATDEVLMSRIATGPVAPIKRYASVPEKKPVIDMLETCKAPQHIQHQSTLLTDEVVMSQTTTGTVEKRSKSLPSPPRHSLLENDTAEVASAPDRRREDSHCRHRLLRADTSLQVSGLQVSPCKRKEIVTDTMMDYGKSIVDQKQAQSPEENRTAMGILSSKQTVSLSHKEAQEAQASACRKRGENVDDNDSKGTDATCSRNQCPEVGEGNTPLIETKADGSDNDRGLTRIERENWEIENMTDSEDEEDDNKDGDNLNKNITRNRRRSKRAKFVKLPKEDMKLKDKQQLSRANDSVEVSGQKVTASETEKYLRRDVSKPIFKEKQATASVKEGSSCETSCETSSLNPNGVQEAQASICRKTRKYHYAEDSAKTAKATEDDYTSCNRNQCLDVKDGKTSLTDTIADRSDHYKGLSRIERENWEIENMTDSDDSNNNTPNRRRSKRAKSGKLLKEDPQPKDNDHSDNKSQKRSVINEGRNASFSTETNVLKVANGDIESDSKVVDGDVDSDDESFASAVQTQQQLASIETRGPLYPKVLKRSDEHQDPPTLTPNIAMPPVAFFHNGAMNNFKRIISNKNKGKRLVGAKEPTDGQAPGHYPSGERTWPGDRVRYFLEQCTLAK